MKNKELKTLWKVAKLFWFCGTIFWIIETVIFLILEGWHYKATNTIEIYCDEIVLHIWKFALTLSIYICICLLININKKKSMQKEEIRYDIKR